MMFRPVASRCSLRSLVVVLALAAAATAQDSATPQRIPSAPRSCPSYCTTCVRRVGKNTSNSTTVPDPNGACCRARRRGSCLVLGGGMNKHFLEETKRTHTSLTRAAPPTLLARNNNAQRPPPAQRCANYLHRLLRNVCAQQKGHRLR